MNKHTPEELEAKRSKVIELALETLDALVAERGDTGKIWASMLKEAIKRRKPDFNESYYGFKSFGILLEEAQTRGLIELGKDEKSGTFVTRASVPPSPTLETSTVEPCAEENKASASTESTEEKKPKATPQKGREHREKRPPKEAATAVVTPLEVTPPEVTPQEAALPEAVPASVVGDTAAPETVVAEKKPARSRRPRKAKNPPEDAAPEDLVSTH